MAQKIRKVETIRRVARRREAQMRFARRQRLAAQAAAEIVEAMTEEAVA